MSPHEKSYLEILPRWFVVWWSLFLSRCWFLSLAVVLLEFSGKVGRRHWKSCGETAGSKGAGTGQTTGCQGEGAAFGRTQVPEVPESLPHSAACGMAGGTLGGGRGVKWKRQGQLARWTLCMGCHKKKWLTVIFIYRFKRQTMYFEAWTYTSNLT